MNQQTNTPKKPTYHIGHAVEEQVFITSPTGHDIIVMRRMTVEMPDLPAENHISDNQWQRIIDAVDVALSAVDFALRNPNTESPTQHQKRNKKTYYNKNFVAEAIAQLMEDRGYYVEDLEHIHELLGKHTQVTKN